MSTHSTSSVLSARLETPLGTLQIDAGLQGLTAITFLDESPAIAGLARRTVDNAQAHIIAPVGQCQLTYLDQHNTQIAAHLTNAVDQLSDYFTGRRRVFQLVLAPKGTEFQQRAWQQLCQIPYGQTWSYGQQAVALGNAKASRAVGAANGKNPLAIVVPCHRVIASNQHLTGYAGGLSRKLALLQLERSFDKTE